MSTQTILTISMAIPLVVLLGLLILLLYIKKQSQGAKQQEFNRLKALLPTPVNKRDWSKFSLQMYPRLKEIPLVRLLLVKLQKRLGIVYAGDEEAVQTKASGYTMIIIATMVLVGIIALLFSDSWSTRIAIVIVTLYLGGFLSDQFIGKAELRMLNEEDEMILDIRHEYHQTYMVVESLDRVGERSKPTISAHAQQIAEVLNDPDSEEELQAYYEVAPNRHMKQLAGISYKISEYGDSDVHNGEESFYLSSLSNIREEIHLDINRRVKLNRLLAGIVFVAVSPIFMVDPIRRWGETSFPIISNYYNSSWGMYSLILLYIIFVLSYIGLRVAKSVDGDAQGVKEEGKWLKKLLAVSWVGKIVAMIAPKPHEAEHFKTQEGIRQANSKLEIPTFYLWKSIFVVIVFVSVLIIQFSVHSNTRNNILYPNQEITANNQSSSQQLLSKERYAFESLLIGEIISKDIGPDEVVPYILSKTEDKNFLPMDIDVNTYAENLSERVNQYKLNHYKWYELVIAFLLALGSYQIPNVYLIFRKQVRRWEMQNEVDGFNTSVMMLSNIESISVYEILEWMHRDSYIFEEQLMNCLLDYEYGAWEALEKLKDDAHFVPLVRLIDRLQEASDRIPVKKAFDDMKIERAFSLEQRKEHYEKITNEKVALGKIAGFTPLGATIVLYLFVPFIYLMFQQLGDLTVITGGL